MADKDVLIEERYHYSKMLIDKAMEQQNMAKSGSKMCDDTRLCKTAVAGGGGPEDPAGYNSHGKKGKDSKKDGPPDKHRSAFRTGSNPHDDKAKDGRHQRDDGHQKKDDPHRLDRDQEKDKGARRASDRLNMPPLVQT